VRSSPWAAAFYQYQRAHGKGHHAAVRALAYKWCASSRYFVGTGTFNDKLFGGAWHVGHGVICQVQGLGLNG